MNDLFFEQNIRIYKENELVENTKYKTIIDYAIEYVAQNKLNIKALKIINFIRLMKEVYFPCD